MVEPKVFSSYVTRKGDVPRKIQVERLLKKYTTFDITDCLNKNGVIPHLIECEQNADKPRSILTMPLHLFDRTDLHYRSSEDWDAAVSRSAPNGLPARALFIDTIKNNEMVILWKNCTIVRSDLSKSQPHRLSVIFAHDPRRLINRLDAIFVCFQSEDPELYCRRLLEAVQGKKLIAATVTMNMYVDCMPVDNLKPLDSEQVNRILGNAINTPKLRANNMLDTSSLLQQYNLNHMRCLNQLILVNMLQKNQKDVQMVRAVSVDPNLFTPASGVFPPRPDIIIETETPLEDRAKSFKFGSLWNKLESLHIMLQIQADTTNLDRVSFFSTPEKTQRIEEFVMNQQAANNSVVAAVKDTWLNAVTGTVKHHLKDVKKGWFNLDESNLEVYTFSKLRKVTIIKIN